MSDPQGRILTEEEIDLIKNYVLQKFKSDEIKYDIYLAVINLTSSHMLLLSANAALSFKNMELQNELAAEKAASEIWRRKLHKEAKPND